MISLVTRLQVLASWFDDVLAVDAKLLNQEDLTAFGRELHEALAEAQTLEATATHLSNSLAHYDRVMRGVHGVMSEPIIAAGDNLVDLGAVRRARFRGARPRLVPIGDGGAA